MATTDDALWLPEHRDNPFIYNLGPVRDLAGMVGWMVVTPDHADSQRMLPTHLRRNYVLRLLDLVKPNTRQVELFGRIDELIRYGYKSRNPAERGHHASIVNAAANAKDAAQAWCPEKPVFGSASGIALFGDPGMGKSRTVRHILASYPRAIAHDGPATVLQVPCVMVECPSASGSRKSICMDIISALGESVGKGAGAPDGYAKLYCKPRTVVDDLLASVQSLVAVHAVGLIVVDEIQHLLRSKEGVGPIMNFLVRLVNVVGIPVLIMGTQSAAKTCGRSFRSARRMAGMPLWSRLERGIEWDRFLDTVWKYQWTKVPTPLPADSHLREAMYDESQGILDVVVKLYMRVQHRAMLHGGDEAIDAELVRQVAADEFKVIAPMISAMRSGEAALIAAFDDLEPFRNHVDDLLGTYDQREVQAAIDAAEKPSDIETAPEGEQVAMVKRSLLDMGYGIDAVDDALTKVLEAEPNPNLFRLMHAVEARLKGTSAAPRGRRPAAKVLPQAASEPDDMRVLLAKAKKEGRPAWAVMAEAGIVDGAGPVGGTGPAKPRAGSPRRPVAGRRTKGNAAKNATMAGKASA